jgi:hypothetical protein
MPFSHAVLPTDVDAIRVLELEPGSLADRLVGRLRSVAFSDKPRYIAFSYTWENSFPDLLQQSEDPYPTGVALDLQFSVTMVALSTLNEIRLDGEPIQIGLNLHLALLHLRSRTHPLSIWVDAI